MTIGKKIKKYAASQKYDPFQVQKPHFFKEEGTRGNYLTIS